MSNPKQYARVESGVVVEFPLYESQIVNRGHTVAMYHEVLSGAKPELRSNEAHTKSFEIYDGRVLLKWGVVLLKPEQFYKRIVKSMSVAFETIVPTVYPQTVDVNMDKLQEMRPLLIECVDAMIDELCDNYAIALGYKNSDRLASYATDPNLSWKADAEAFIEIRSNAYTYMFNALLIENLVTNNQISTTIKPTLDIVTNLFKGA